MLYLLYLYRKYIFILYFSKYVYIVVFIVLLKQEMFFFYYYFLPT